MSAGEQFQGNTLGVSDVPDEKERARRYVTRVARDADDEALLMDVLFGTGLPQQHKGAKGKPTPKEKAPRPSRATKPEREHGTTRMYRWEIAQGIEPCRPCKDAINALRREEREAKARREAEQEAAERQAIDDAWTDFGRLKGHGTIASYRRESRLGQVPCRECTDAVAAYVRSRRPGPTKRKPDNPVCGTEGGYQKHRRRRQTPCGPCRKAHAEGLREYRTKKKQEALSNAS